MTATRTLILAGSFSEAAKYARGKQLRGYRYVVSAASVGSYQATDIVALPGYESRHDKHAINSALKPLARRGVEVRKDSYTPPPPEPPPFRETLTKFDWLFGNVPTGDELRELGATEVEVKMLTDIAPAAEKIAAAIQDAAALTKDDFVESAPTETKRRGRPPGSKNKPRITPGPPATPADLAEAKRRVNVSKSDEPLENNVSGRGSESEPKAKTGSVDDLFED